MSDKEVAQMTAPEIMELIMKLLEELELRFMEATNDYKSN